MVENETRKPRGPCRPGDPDEEAVARILAGRKAAEDLDAKYRSGLLEHAASSLRDRERAKAVVQGTMGDAWEKLGTFKGLSSYFSWLYGIYKYRLLAEQRAVKVAAGREKGFESDAADRSEDMEDQDAARPRESGWIDQIEQALTVGRQHTPEGDHEQRERLLEVVGDIRESLPQQTKEVFLLMLAGLSVGEIALLLKSSEANVRGHLMRGREVLKEKRDQRGKRD